MRPELAHVQALFGLFSGEDLTAGDARAQLCLRLCADCLAAVADRDTTAPAAAALENWQAAEAFYQLALIDEAAAPEAVTADGVRVTAAPAARRARELRDEKRRIARRLLGEEAFYFGRM